MSTFFKIVNTCLFLFLVYGSVAQKPKKQYNEAMRITECFDAEGNMIGFSRVNKRKNTEDHYSMEGRLIRSVPLPKDSVNVEKPKQVFPKSELSKAELKMIPKSEYEMIEGQTLIKEPNPDLQIIGYYNLDGKLVGYYKYHRGLEDWHFHWLEQK